MSKRKKSNNKYKKHNNIRIFNTPDKSTLLESFKFCVSDESTVDEIIAVLSMLNARCLTMIGRYADLEDVPENIQNEIVEFCAYFNTNYHEMTEKARYENWGEDDAFILSLGHAISGMRDDDMADAYMKNLSDFQKSEIQSFTEALFSVRKDRNITFVWDGEMREMSVPRTIPRQYLSDVKNLIHEYVMFVVADMGTVLVREYINGFKHPEAYVYAYRMNEFGGWEAVPEKALLEAYTHNQNGDYIPIEDGVTLITRMRNKNNLILVKSDKNS